MKQLSKLYKLLNKKERLNFVIILFMTFIAMILEAFGLSLVIPLISTIVSSEFYENNKYLKIILNFFGNPSKETFIIYFLIFLIIYFLLKNLFLSLLMFFQINLQYDVRTRISHDLFDHYINKPYVFHLNNNSSVLNRNLIYEVTRVSGLIMYLQTFITEIIISVGILSVIIIFQPMTAPILFSVGLFGLFFVSFTKKRLFLLGKKRLEAEETRVRKAQEGFSGVKEIKLLGVQNFFTKLFLKATNEHGNVSVISSLIAQIPRYILEFLGILIIASIFFLMFFMNNSSEEIFVVLSIFAASALKLIPSINKILSSYSQLIFTMPALNIILSEFDDYKPNVISKDTKLLFKNNIEIKELSFSYGEDTDILKNINLSIKKGEFIGIKGPSGSGKSTLINIFIGLLDQGKGEIKLDGSMVFTGGKSWRDLIGYVPQQVFLFDSSLKENIVFNSKINNENDTRFRKIIKDAQISEFIGQLPNAEKTIIGERGARISGGQMQRLGIARSLYSNKEILVFDEATSALDVDLESELMKVIESFKGKKTILMVTHRESCLKNCDHVFELKNGLLKKCHIKNSKG